MINTNLGSLFNMCRQVIEGMRERKFGRIVNISSINGQKGQFGQVNYSAAKAGEIGFTKALAQEGARAGITVNAICPGYIATDMVKAMSQEVLQKNVLPQIPIGRLGEPEEIARCVVFLASDDAGLDHRLDSDGQRRAIFRLEPEISAALTNSGRRIVMALSPQPIIERRREQMFPDLDPLEIERMRRFGEFRTFARGRDAPHGWQKSGPASSSSSPATSTLASAIRPVIAR